MAERIFIAEDDDSIRELLRCTLESFGYTVSDFADGQALLDQIEPACLPDLVILDIMMPVKDGLQTLSELRQREETRDLPAIMVTAKDAEIDKVRGLDLGADDYITKPFGILELSSRVKAVLRRSARGGRPAQVIQIGDIVLDSGKVVVYQGKQELELTNKEFKLLSLLMRNCGIALPREEILNKVWGYDYIGETRTLDMHIRSLRQKLGDDAETPRYIKTVRSVGYKFMEPSRTAGGDGA
ncbi:response regulator transcription factor [Neobittarella massiliensis]|uniref:Stage 0 sporulation protein A homolog n=2 Tax=Oscillospiraceae TaxID=216572 RepID=A0A8J6M1M1_9FIRM|nr:response regulator transcription factor [Neobittarella massiliensis]MBC3516571.1 response regulator transcription factor [Neobittarella massiliensis]SCJ75948.1 Transcriptional regulatory protein YycF [uncultured Anaerotruncus sp.]